MYQSLLQATAGFYLLATGAFILYLFSPRESFSRAGQGLLLAGFIGHAVSSRSSFMTRASPALAQTAATHSFYGWLMVGVCLTVQFRHRYPILGCFVAPLLSFCPCDPSPWATPGWRRRQRCRPTGCRCT